MWKLISHSLRDSVSIHNQICLILHACLMKMLFSHQTRWTYRDQTELNIKAPSSSGTEKFWELNDLWQRIDTEEFELFHFVLQPFWLTCNTVKLTQRYIKTGFTLIKSGRGRAPDHLGFRASTQCRTGGQGQKEREVCEWVKAGHV